MGISEFRQERGGGRGEIGVHDCSVPCVPIDFAALHVTGAAAAIQPFAAHDDGVFCAKLISIGTGSVVYLSTERNFSDRKDRFMSIKLKYYSPLYLSGGITEKKLDKIKRKLASRPVLADVYLISPARNGRDQLEIYNSGLLQQSYYRSKPPLVIGVSQTYDEAVELVRQMAERCFESRGDCAIKEYLSC